MDHTHWHIDHAHNFPCGNSLEQVDVIGCGLVEAVVHFVPATTVEFDTLEDGEESRGGRNIYLIGHMVKIIVLMYGDHD